MDLYIVGGPYHLFNTMNLRLNEYANNEAHLVIMDKFSMASAYAKQIEQYSIFNRVYLISLSAMQGLAMRFDNLLMSCMSYSKVLFPSAFMPRIRKNLPFAINTYENIFIAGLSPAWLVFISYQCKRNKTSLYFYDDGWGQRANAHLINPNIFARSPRSGRRNPGFAAAKRYITDNFVKGRYYYSPEMVVNQFQFPNLQQIKPLEMSWQKQLLLSNVFGYSSASDPLASVPILYLPNGMDRSAANMSFAAKDEVLANKICKRYPGIAKIKTHPASKAVFPAKYALEKTTYPIELSMMFQSVDDQILISPYSVSLINPKFIFEKEPYIIFVYKLLGISEEKILNSSGEAFVHAMNISIVNRYDKEKIYIPETEDELFRILDRLLQAKAIPINSMTN